MTPSPDGRGSDGPGASDRPPRPVPQAEYDAAFARALHTAVEVAPVEPPPPALLTAILGGRAGAATPPPEAESVRATAAGPTATGAASASAAPHLSVLRRADTQSDAPPIRGRERRRRGPSWAPWALAAAAVLVIAVSLERGPSDEQRGAVLASPDSAVAAGGNEPPDVAADGPSDVAMGGPSVADSARVRQPLVVKGGGRPPKVAGGSPPAALSAGPPMPKIASAPTVQSAGSPSGVNAERWVLTSVFLNERGLGAPHEGPSTVLLAALPPESLAVTPTWQSGARTRPVAAGVDVRLPSDVAEAVVADTLVRVLAAAVADVTAQCDRDASPGGRHQTIHVDLASLLDGSAYMRAIRSQQADPRMRVPNARGPIIWLSSRLTTAVRNRAFPLGDTAGPREGTVLRYPDLQQAIVTIRYPEVCGL